MDFGLTEEQKMIRDMCRRFADEVIAPRVEEMERTGEYPYDIIAQMGELGMMGIPFPEEYGGSGGDWVSMMLCTMEISRADGALGALLDVNSSCARNCSDSAQKNKKGNGLFPWFRGRSSEPLRSPNPMRVPTPVPSKQRLCLTVMSG